jgi:hypothetical protein
VNSPAAEEGTERSTEGWWGFAVCRASLLIYTSTPERVDVDGPWRCFFSVAQVADQNPSEGDDDEAGRMSGQAE